MSLIKTEEQSASSSTNTIKNFDDLKFVNIADSPLESETIKNIGIQIPGSYEIVSNEEDRILARVNEENEWRVIRINFSNIEDFSEYEINEEDYFN